MGKRGSKGRGRGGRGGHAQNRPGSDFGDEFIALGDIVDFGRRGGGRGRGAFAQMSTTFIPAASRGRDSPRGGYRGAAPLAPRGRGSSTPRGGGDYHPRGRGDTNFRGRGRGRGDLAPRGRGRGFGYNDGGRDNGNEFAGYRNRLLEPIRFVPAELTPRTLFQEEEEIFKAEVVDLEQGDSVPTADVIEAAFAAQLNAEEDEDKESGEDEDDLQGTPTPATNTPSSFAPVVASSSKQPPKLDISSAVSLATALKDAALTPREEHFLPMSPAISNAVIEENTRTASSTINPDSDSESDSEDIVLFVPQPRTPLRPMTPLPLLAAPGAAHTFGVAPSPIRPSPLAMSFGPLLQETGLTLDAIMEKPASLAEASTERGLDPEPPVNIKIEKIGALEMVASETDIPTVNFEDLSEVMFIDTTPTPVKLPSKEGRSNSTEKARGPILGISSPKPPPPSAPNFHDMTFKFTSRSTTAPEGREAPATELPSKSDSTTGTTTTTTELASATAVTIPPAPSFHDMKFTFKPRDPASRARKPPPNASRQGLGFKPKRSPRVPREGDSDLEWGSDGPPKSKSRKNKAGLEKEDKVESESDGDHGMVEDIDPVTMLAFLKGVMAPEWVSMDDIKDEHMLRQEDEDEEDDSESEESEEEDEDEDDSEDEDFNRIIAAGEAELVDSDNEEANIFLEDDSDPDLDESFGTRLARMRMSGGKGKERKSRGNKKGKGRVEDEGEGEGEGEDDDDDDEVQMSGFSWAEKDENYIAAIQDKLDEEMLLKRERKRGIISPPMSPALRGKNKYVPAELHAQWERDRSKKAENKRLRALQRQAAAQETPKRGSGSKSKASYMFNSGPMPTLISLEPRLREFAANLDMRNMALPAMDKESRRRVHLLAECFGIKTDSKGKGTGRYVTLIRTSRTGLSIDEGKVRKLVRAAEDAEEGGMAAFNRSYYRRDNDGPGGSGGKVFLKTRDGEVVGRAAAKIGGDNIGHRLLSKMGWSEGDRIGKSGGIADPLIAVMKNTKLGLGATRK